VFELAHDLPNLQEYALDSLHSIVISASHRGTFDFSVLWALPRLLALFLIWILVFTLTAYVPRPQISSRYARNKDGQIVDIVDALCAREATNPEDMSFGLRSVLQRLSPDINLPDPDYTLPQTQIYKELTIQRLKTTNSLDFLIPASLNRKYESHPGLPTGHHHFLSPGSPLKVFLQQT
jgi:hypothetical protein